jgi:hypothetical protein
MDTTEAITEIMEETAQLSDNGMMATLVDSETEGLMLVVGNIETENVVALSLPEAFALYEWLRLHEDALRMLTSE